MGEGQLPMSPAEYFLPLDKALKYSLSHIKEWHYNLVAAAMKYTLVPSPCPMNKKHIAKQNLIIRQYQELPIHQHASRPCLGCGLEQQLQWWNKTEISYFSIKSPSYSISHQMNEYLNIWYKARQHQYKINAPTPSVTHSLSHNVWKILMERRIQTPNLLGRKGEHH